MRATSNTRGFSLIELLVALGISSFIAAASFSFVVQQTKTMAHTEDHIQRDRGSRAAIELILNDVRHAGAGLGMSMTGNFGGLRVGGFTVPGGASFQTQDRNIDLNYGPNTAGLNGTYTSITDDIGVRYATGDFRSILSLSAGTGQICSGLSLAAGQHVAFLSPDGMAAQSARVDAATPATCTMATCMTGSCTNITWTNDNLYQSDTGAGAASYVTGEMAEDFQNAVWFVATNARGSSDLRRANVTAESPCAAADQTCGQVIAYDVESVQTQLFSWDTTTRTWTDQTNAANIPLGTALRMDLEVVARTGSAMDREPEGIALALENGTCVPGPCGSRDQYSRDAMRASVQIRNSALSRF